MFCYGINTSVNEVLNNFIADYDLEFSKKVNKINYEVSTPYHGGQCSGDIYSVVFGTYITDDDNNPDYIKTIRTSNEEDYKESFDIFKSEYIDELKSILESDSFDEEETKLFNELIIFIENEEPSFYDVEASS